MVAPSRRIVLGQCLAMHAQAYMVKQMLRPPDASDGTNKIYSAFSSELTPHESVAANVERLWFPISRQGGKNNG